MTSATAPLRGPLRKRESHLWQRDEHDWYIEPIWCSARLFEAEKFEGGIWDLRAAADAFRRLRSTPGSRRSALT
jgi:hypothetical protein